MQPQQQFVMAADMLVAGRSLSGGEPDLPSDSLIENFQAEISTGCEADPNQKVVDIAAAIYQIDRTKYGP